MRSRFLLAVLAAGALACGGGGDSTGVTTGTGTTTGTTTGTGTTSPVITTSVSMVSSSFTPPNIQVSPGSAVTWTNNDGITHNVTFTSGTSVSSGDFSGGTKTLTMPTTAGTYSYHCTIHGGMTGTVVVQ